MSKLPTIAVTPPSAKSKLPPVQLAVVTDGQQLPAVAKAPKRPIRALKDFADRCDTLKAAYSRMQNGCENIRSVSRCPLMADAQKCLDDASLGLERYEKYYRELAKDLALALREQFNPENAFDDDGQLTEDRVRPAIAILVGSYPNAAPGNPEAYIGMMVEEVMAEDISLPELESACSSLRRTSKFPPSISELIEAIHEQVEMWEPRFEAINCFESVAGYLRDELKVVTELVAASKVEQEERRRVAAEKKRADDELRARPLAVGDRVRGCGEYSHSGPGTIEKESWFGFEVLLDKACQRLFAPEWLVRLIPGDRGFEITEAERAEIAQKLAERAKPLAIGDRVSWRSAVGVMFGVIVEIRADIPQVLMDDGMTAYPPTDNLVRVLAVDSGFDMPLAQRAKVDRIIANFAKLRAEAANRLAGIEVAPVSSPDDLDFG